MISTWLMMFAQRYIHTCMDKIILQESSLELATDNNIIGQRYGLLCSHQKGFKNSLEIVNSL